MKVLKGIPVSSGVAIGIAFVRYSKKITIPKKQIPPHKVIEELHRFDKAVENELQELQNVIDNYTQDSREKDLLDTQVMILKDPMLLDKINSYIRDRLFTAEYSLQLYQSEVVSIFSAMSNSYLAERVSDYEDIITRLIGNLRGTNNNLMEEVIAGNEGKSIILILDDISPTDVAKSYHSNVIGICLSRGSKTSHSAIIARAFGLPVVVGINELFESINNGDRIIMNGTDGSVIIQPDEDTLKEYEQKLEGEKLFQKGLEKIINDPVQTADGKSLQLLSNIELEQEVDLVLEMNADGVGLYRTEYLFVDRDTLPSEEEQFQVYHSIASKLADKQIIIRTYDLGGDKLAETISTEFEANPFLGCRGIRLSLRYPDLFKTQIKAILRANTAGNISIMFPLVTSVTDVRESIKIVEECKEELREQGVSFNGDIPIGAMIEVPAAVFSVSELAQVCDFFSIGTNDLVQYTLAADRNNKSVEKYYDPYHPAVIKLIALTVLNAHRYGKTVSICGEIASESAYLSILVGLDIDSLSVNPNSLLNVKNHLSKCSYKRAKILAKKLIKANTSEEVKKHIATYNEA